MIQNKDVLTALRTNFDKPEQMKELQKRLSGQLQCFSLSVSLCMCIMVTVHADKSVQLIPMLKSCQCKMGVRAINQT